jgi:hypothetical protein
MPTFAQNQHMSAKKFSKFLRLVAILLCMSEAASLSAAGGDTTWVTVFTNLKLTHYGNYDTTVVFPSAKRYRKIRMHYILGRYACPSGTQYCGSWDYTTQIFSLPKGKDTVEVARIITPYATDWLQKNLSHDYIVDVSDYASVLEDSTHMRYHYDGYSWGFTLTLKLEFIEGIPPRDAISVKNVYNGYFAYGNAADPIENHLSAKTLSYTSPSAALKNTVSGHGSDNTGCSEFCNKYYQLRIDNNLVAQKQIWRSNCGSNEVYPQTGTWVFERGNWCPGAVVWPIYHELDSVTDPLTPFGANIDMQSYTVSNPSAGYNFVTQLVSYGNYNHSRDISIEDIISPSADLNYIRENPACKNPIISIRNTGSDVVSEVGFEYGMPGLVPFTYTYSGVIKPLETVEVVLPNSTTVMSHSAEVPFEARVVSVNGITGDDYSDNDIYSSVTRTVSVFPKDLVIKMGTNGSVDNFVSETSWTIYDENDLVVAQRANAAPSTNYTDTLRDLPDGCYKFVVEDKGCDGFNWWYYQYYQPNPGNGSLRIDKITVNSPLLNIPGDIGCGYTLYFYVGNYPDAPGHVGLNEIDLSNEVQLYPNPAQGWALIRFNLSHSAPAAYSITDITGKKVAERAIGAVDFHNEQVDLSGIKAGIYFVRINVEGYPPLTKKLIVN